MPPTLARRLPEAVARRRPLSAYRLDWANPLCAGLIWCVMPGQGFEYDLVEGGRPTLNATTFLTGSCPVGGGLYQSTATPTGTHTYWPASERFREITTAFSLAVWVEDRDTASAYTTLWRVPINTTNTNPYICLEVVNGGAAFDWTNQRVSFAYGGGSNQFRTAVLSGYIESDTAPLVFRAFSRVDSDCLAYKDGRYWGSAAFGGNEGVYWSPTMLGPGLLSGGESSGANGLVGVAPFAAIWNRALTDGEHAALARDPFALLEWPAERGPWSGWEAPAAAAVSRPPFRARWRVWPVTRNV